MIIIIGIANIGERESISANLSIWDVRELMLLLYFPILLHLPRAHAIQLAVNSIYIIFIIGRYAHTNQKWY